MRLESPAFEDGQALPEQYSCDGEDISPPLAWSGSPEGTQSYVLILDDPDAPGGTFVHWVAYNIPASQNTLAENIPPREQPDQLFYQGRNDFGNIGYGGACPPKDHGAHRYNFRLYALDTVLDQDFGADKNEIGKAMQGHTLAEARLSTHYER